MNTVAMYMHAMGHPPPRPGLVNKMVFTAASGSLIQIEMFRVNHFGKQCRSSETSQGSMLSRSKINMCVLTSMYLVYLHKS